MFLPMVLAIIMNSAYLWRFCCLRGSLTAVAVATLVISLPCRDLTVVANSLVRSLEAMAASKKGSIDAGWPFEKV